MTFAEQFRHIFRSRAGLCGLSLHVLAAAAYFTARHRPQMLWDLAISTEPLAKLLFPREDWFVHWAFGFRLISFAWCVIIATGFLCYAYGLSSIRNQSTPGSGE